MLYIGKSPDKPSGIALADPVSGTPQLGAQSWPSTYLNIPWSDGSYKAVIGDFNHDGCADILLQPQATGTVYVLLATCSGPNAGQFQGISQAIPQMAFNIDWSAAQHRVQAADFNADGFTDLFFQSTTAGGKNAIVLTDGAHGTTGNLFCLNTSSCWTGAPQQTWLDGYQGFKWSTQAAVVTVGDFNGDHRGDLLVQTKPTFVMIDYDVPFPVPKYTAQSFGIFLGQTPDSSGAMIRTPNQLWNVNDLGGNWSPLNSTVIVGDFHGDCYAGGCYTDVLLQSKSPGRANVLLAGSASGVLSSATSVASNAGSWTGNSYQLLVGKFGNSSIDVLYGQATSAGGSNFYSSNISSGNVTATTSALQIAAVATAPATGVGATAGSADVSASGTGRYTIPLQLSPGTAGLTPQLALQYQHSGSNGLLGVGWGLSGLSIITRCPMTIAQDGVTQGVQGVAADQYCLDGNRLRLTSGSQGADGSQYRTELETYSLIKAHGPGTNGPLWFEVWRKDGQVYEYGNTPDSQINMPGGGAATGTRVWALNKIHDRAMNYIALSYINDTAHGSYRPNQILYSGNSTQGTAPPYTIQFTYQGRNSGEILTHNYLGQTITEVNRLRSIQVQYGGTVVRGWTLGYDIPATMSHFSRITSIQECGENNDCLPATTFNWSTAQMSGALPAFSNSTQYYDYSGLNYSGLAQGIAIEADLNGDGIPDTVMWNNQHAVTPYTCSLTVQWGVPNGQPPYPAPQNLPTPDCASYPPQGVMDVDLDGKDDVVLGGFYVHQKADGTLSVDSTGLASAGTVDVDGDGYPDFVYQGSAPNNNSIYVAFHNHDGSPGYQSPVIAWTAPAGTNILYSYNYGNGGLQWRTVIQASDFNGDGRGDLLVQTTGGWQVLYSNGSTFTAGDLFVTKTYGSGTGTTYITPLPIDVNGDGCTDLAYPNNVSNPTWQVAINKCGTTGPGFATVDTLIQDPLDTGTGSGWVPNSYPSAVDLNLDGYHDLVFTTTNSVRVVAYSLGTTLASPVSTVGPYFADRDGDGLPDQMGCISPSGACVGYIQAMLGPKPDLLLTATDGFNNTVNFTYAPLTDSTVYTRGQGHTGATRDMSGSMYVVKQLQSNDGVGGTYALTYAYANALRNVQGRGFLGFGTRKVTDSRTGFVTTETYNQAIASNGTQWEFVGTLAERKVTQGPAGATVSDEQNQWMSIAPDGAANRRYPYIQSKTDLRYELNGSLVSTVATNTTIDNYGTPYDVTVTTTENSTGSHGGSSRTQHRLMSSIVNDATDWCLSRPAVTATTTSHTLTDGAPAITQTVNQSWDGPNCRLTDRNLVGVTGPTLNTHYDYDAWNNVLYEKVTGSGIPVQRATKFDYSTSTSPGQFLMTVTRDPTDLNPSGLNQQTKFTWYDALGAKHTATDPNGFQTLWAYDDFGRKNHEVRPDGTGSRRTYSACNGSINSCGDGLLRYVVQEDERNTSDQVVSYQYVFLDSFNRVKYDETLGFGGALSVVETLYDPRGNVASRSMPYYAGTDVYRGTAFSYDLYNRVTKTQRPTSDSNPALATTTTVYTGLTVTEADALSHSHTHVSDAWGDVIQVIDEASHYTYYTYNGLSELKSTTDANGNQATIAYNDRGFKVGSSDPDMGTWIYSNDAAGELLTQTDAKGQQTQFHYDVLGRMDKRWDPGAASWDSFFNYDAATNGIGQLGSMTGPSGFSEVYTYDTKGRRSTETTTAAGSSYAVDYGYDPTLGKLQTITYPTVNSARFEVFYDYQNGYLKDVKNYTGQVAGTVFWQANAQDARGHVTQEALGNGQQAYLNFDETSGLLNYVQTGPGGGTATQDLGYTWDAVGNLISRNRNEAGQNLVESFQYDALNRLLSTEVNSNPAVTFTYDALGNVSSKSDVGTSSHTYNYTTTQTGCSYAGLTAQPHAVRNAGGNVYCYDPDGNVITRTGGTVSWTSYNLPQTITQVGGNSSTFYYRPDRARYRQTSVTASTTEDRTYIGALFEKTITNGTSTDYRHYIIANDNAVAIQVIRSTGVNDAFYLHDDHLGSTDVVTNALGAVVVRESFDAWGQRRSGGWVGPPTATEVSADHAATIKGFTGQEQMDNLNLVHLNGRVYDPVIARFLSADPYIQAPLASQSLNRYSYTWDNPLNQTDPTGFCSSDQRDCPPEPAKQTVVVTATQEQTQTVTVTGTRASEPQNNSAQQTAGSPVQAGGQQSGNQNATVTILITAGRGLIRQAATATVRFVGTQVALASVAVVLVLTPSNGFVGDERVKCMDEALCTRAYNQVGEVTDSASDPASDEDQNQGADAGEGCIYCVNGDKTSSGKDYVGSSDDLSKRQRDKSDGRDRTDAEVVDRYPKGNRDVRRSKEQQHMNDRGGVDKLDNKRNEVAPDKWSSKGITPP